MFNWLFGKKKEAVTENVVESTGTKNVFEVFEDLAPVFKDNQKALNKLHMLPEVYILLKDDLLCEPVGCAYLSKDGYLVEINKRLKSDMKTYLHVSQTKVQPPVMRIAENIQNNFKKWIWCFDENLKRLVYVERELIRFDNNGQTLTVGTDTIKLDWIEVCLLENIILNKLNNKLKEEETQKRATMDEVVAELFKGE